MEKDYTALLDELREGTLDKLEINTEEFMDFQKLLWIIVIERILLEQLNEVGELPIFIVKNPN